MQLRKGPVFVGMNPGWIITTLKWHKITTITPEFKYMGGKVSGPRNQNTFNLYRSNIKLISIRSTNCIIPTQR